MKENYNFNALFINSTNQSFIKRLDLDENCQKVLDRAVDAVKEKLTPSLTELAIAAGVDRRFAGPRYRLQGSQVYKTQNLPAYSPEQQVDVDLGVYLSASFMDTLTQNGRTIKVPAKQAAKLYFDTVDKLLRQLCKEEGWNYVEGKGKNTKCCRIDLSPEGVDAHIDVPLYAAPNDEFVKLAKALTPTFDSVAKYEAYARDDKAPQIDDEGWEELQVIVMATREGEWTESDVQIVIQHFKDATRKCGHPFILRRLWRYVKAWRDYAWRDGGGPSSVLLMEAVVRILDTNVKTVVDLLNGGRDDRLLLYVFKGLTEQLNDDIIVQWGTQPEPLNTSNAEKRREWVNMAIVCAGNLHRCFYDNFISSQQVIALVTQPFGERIPDDVSLVKAVVGSPAIVLGTPKQQETPQSRIHRTQGA
ncbi:CBASS cGAMP synthase [Oxalobacteraceae bacterium R-40]|uniref:Cyclic GMP-AMP synthase n=1 Tax=Keguizhuia sedimenti TaxID=3064264 RepID=A0ABU1BSR3_9BURK|nr:CBASS cGAMP synthase [Oxalobacteraceae bacterium R-40]